MNVVVQVEVAAPLVASVQGLGTTVAVEPVGWEVMEKLTLPCGGLFVPGAVSVTVTVQVAGAFAGIDAGEQPGHLHRDRHGYSARVEEPAAGQRQLRHHLAADGLDRHRGPQSVHARDERCGNVDLHHHVHRERSR